MDGKEMIPFPISPLSLDTLTRDAWGSFDATILAQLAPLCENECYQPKIYRAPALSNEVLGASAYVSHGLRITPGSIIYGIYLPPANPVGASSVASGLPQQFNLQIRDMNLKHDFWDSPIPSLFVANWKPSYLSAAFNECGAFPNLLDAPYPVVGDGLFNVEIWGTQGQRIELVFGVFEAIGKACL